VQRRCQHRIGSGAVGGVGVGVGEEDEPEYLCPPTLSAYPDVVALMIKDLVARA